MTTPTHHIRATLGFTRASVPIAVSRSKDISNGLTNNAGLFPGSANLVTALNAAILAVDTAQQAVTGTRARGTTQSRKLKLDALFTQLDGVVTFVQALCDANPETASQLIKAANLVEAGVPIHIKELLGLTSPTAGVVLAKANLKLLKAGRGKARNTTVNYRCSVDGGKTFQSQSINAAHATFSGLQSLSTAMVEVSITDSGGTTDWSNPVSIMVK